MILLRKVDLTDYDAKVETKDGEITVPYFMKKSLALALYTDELKLSSRDLLRNDRIAQKIEGSDGFILLEDADYEVVKQAIESIHGYNKPDVELVRRVIEAQVVDVKIA